jgi:hypothetical protein
MTDESLNEKPDEGEHKRIMRRAGLKVYREKTIEELTEEECEEARRYIHRVAGVIYI